MNKYACSFLVVLLLKCVNSTGQQVEVIPQERPSWYVYDCLLASNDDYLLYTESDHLEREWTVMDFKRKWVLFKIPGVTAMVNYKNQVIVSQQVQPKQSYSNTAYFIKTIHLDKHGKSQTWFNNRKFSGEVLDMELSADEKYLFFVTRDSLFYADLAKNKIVKSVLRPYGTSFLSLSADGRFALLRNTVGDDESNESIHILDFANVNLIQQSVYKLKEKDPKILRTKEVTVLQTASEILALNNKDFSLVKQWSGAFNASTPIAYNNSGNVLLMAESKGINDSTDRVKAYRLRDGELVHQSQVPHETFDLWITPLVLNDSVIIAYSLGNPAITMYNIKQYKIIQRYENIPCNLSNLKVLKTKKENDLVIGTQCQTIYVYNLDAAQVKEKYPAEKQTEKITGAQESSGTLPNALKFEWGTYNFCSNKLVQLPGKLGIQYSDQERSTKGFYKKGDYIYVKDLEKDLVVARFYISVLPKETVTLHHFKEDYYLTWQFKNNPGAAAQLNDPDYKRNRIIMHYNELHENNRDKAQVIDIPVNWDIIKQEGDMVFIASPTRDSCIWYKITADKLQKHREFYPDYKKLGYSPFIDSAYIKYCAANFIPLQNEVDDFTGDEIKRIYKYEVNQNRIIVSPNARWLIRYSSLDSTRYHIYNLYAANQFVKSASKGSCNYMEVFDAFGNASTSLAPGPRVIPCHFDNWEFVPWNEDLLLFREEMNFSVLDLKTNKIIYATGITENNRHFDQDKRTIHFISKDSLYSFQTETPMMSKKMLKNRERQEFRFLSSKLLGTGYNTLYNYQNHHVFRYFIFPNVSIVIDSNNYYMSNGPISNELIFCVDSTYYEFKQFDLKYNRPDILIDELSCNDSVLVNAYTKAHQKRLKKLGFTEEMLKNDYHIPQLKINNFRQLNEFTDSLDLNLDIEMWDEKYKLHHLNIYLNDVPLYGSLGYDLKQMNVNRLSIKHKISLAQGQNKIQVSVMNQAGAESYKETIYITYKPKTPRKPDLYLVTIGDSKYNDQRFNLSYAAKDAKDIATCFQKNKEYQNIYTYIYTDKKVTKQNILHLKEKLKKAQRDDVVMITVAGHGVLDKDLNYYLATYDMDFNNPSAKGLPYEELEALVDGIAPLRKVVFIDACHSGEVDKEEVEQLATNNTSQENVKFRTAGAGLQQKQLGLKTTSELMAELFADLRKGTGATVISSAGGVEYAMESDQWKNGLFTYCLLHGLKDKEADLDKDGKIMLSELQQYLRTEVIKLSNGKQQPTSRIENLSMDFRIW